MRTEGDTLGTWGLFEGVSVGFALKVSEIWLAMQLHCLCTAYVFFMFSYYYLFSLKF